MLFGLRPRLLEAGILYPDLTPRSATIPHLSHQYLGEGLDGRRPRSERSELLGALASQLGSTDADTVLLSYEGLCLASPRLGVPQRLAALFTQHGFAMEVLVTVKPQDELVNSSYTWRMQFLREWRPFTPYFRAEIGQARLDLSRLLRGWRVACGDRMSAVATRDASSDRPLVERVFAELGLLPRLAGMMGADDLALVENRSPGPVAIEVERQLRRGGGHLLLGPAARDATRFVEEAARLRGVNDAPFMGLDAASRAVAAHHWSKANDRFARHVWGDTWSARVAASQPAPCNELAGHRDPDGHVADILAETCERFRLRLEAGPLLALRDTAASVASRLGHAMRYGRAMG